MRTQLPTQSTPSTSRGTRTMPCLPPRYQLRRFSYLDEYEQTWGRPWGARGSENCARSASSLRRTTKAGALHARSEFFLLRYRSAIDVAGLDSDHKQGCNARRARRGIHWMEFEDVWGAHGPMRKLFVCEEVKFVSRWRHHPRFGHALLSSGGSSGSFRSCHEDRLPDSFHGPCDGVMEVGPMLVGLTGRRMVAGLSCAPTARTRAGQARSRGIRSEGAPRPRVPLILDSFAGAASSIST